MRLPSALILAMLVLPALAGCAPKKPSVLHGPLVARYDDGTPVFAAPRTSGSLQSTATAGMATPLPPPVYMVIQPEG